MNPGQTIHELVNKVMQSPVVDSTLAKLPEQVRDLVNRWRTPAPTGEAAAGSTQDKADTMSTFIGTVRELAVKMRALVDGDVEEGGEVKAVNVLRGNVKGGHVTLVNVLRGDVHGGEVTKTNVIVGDVHGGTVRSVNVLLGDVHGGEVHTALLIGKIYGGQVKAMLHLGGRAEVH
jgi:hypothetical protein